MNKLLLKYLSPNCVPLSFSWEQLICSSPNNGSNEDLVYEEWGIEL